MTTYKKTLQYGPLRKEQVYSTVSGHRFSTDLREAKSRGYLSRLPHYNTVFRGFASKVGNSVGDSQYHLR